MSFVCCGVKYSKNDPETYWCIETDTIKIFTKKKVKDNKVCKEIVETLICKKNGCLQVHIKRFGQSKGRFKILEVEKLSGDEAALFLINTESIRLRQSQICPIKMTPFSKRIPLCYGKFISSTTQRARYLNEQDWGFNSKVMYCECKVSKI